jgi:cephalosporin hydroxylase
MFNQLCKTSSDINEHLLTLRDLAKECSHITEMGVRYIVSTWAFIEGMEKGKLVSIDHKHPSIYGGDITAVEQACKDKGINFTFIEADTREITIEKTDLLFIDTDHTYEQLSAELKKHANKAKKYIVLHDTESCPEMLPAISELKGWKVHAHYKNNNGLTVLTKI